MEPTADRAELIALAVTRTAVRGRLLDGGPATYRRSLTGIIPGQRLTVSVETRWTFRKTPMIGGALLHAGFSLRALRQAGFDLPELAPPGMRCPGDADPRLGAGLDAFEAGQWASARESLLRVLESHPACLRAHAAMGSLLAQLEHRDEALQHLTAAIRLGLGAASPGRPLLDPVRPVERDLLCALLVRAELLAARGAAADAETDLRRALAWDPADGLGAAARLAALQRQPCAASTP